MISKQTAFEHKKQIIRTLEKGASITYDPNNGHAQLDHLYGERRDEAMRLYGMIEVLEAIENGDI